MSLHRLLYISESQIDRSQGSITAQLASLMSVSNRNNRASGITGALVYDDGWFLQALEGERSAILHTFERIGDDERHAGCKLVEMVAIEKRIFGNWWMGLATRDAVTAPAFEADSIGNVLRPDAMSAGEILDLMRRLAKLGLRRQVNDETLMA